MGWLESGIDLNEAEDVAQHTFETSTIALVILDSTEQKLDDEKTLRMALIHDWAESVTGDLSKEMTEQIGTQAKKEIEEKALEALLEHVSQIRRRNEYSEILKEYNRGKTLEAKLVKAADKISILMEANKIAKPEKNSEKLEKIWKKTREKLVPFVEDFPVLEDLLQDLDADSVFAR